MVKKLLDQLHLRVVALVVSRAKSEHITKENGSFYCLCGGRADLAVSAGTSQFTLVSVGFDFHGVAREMVRNSCLGAVSQQQPIGNTVLHWEQGTGPPTLACTPLHRDPQGPQPGHRLSAHTVPSRFGARSSKKASFFPDRIRQAKPCAESGHGAGRNSAGTWEPLLNPWPCPRLHGKAKGV